MLGYAHAAGFGAGRTREDVAGIAEHYSVPAERLVRGLYILEAGELPEILLLQNANLNAKVRAAAFFSSVWSRAYTKVGTPYGKVHRDFHYQCLFSALSTLAEIGCDRIRIDNPMSGHIWRKDAYICLLEATRNVRKHLNPRVAVHLQEGSYEPQMPRSIDADMAAYHLQEHRPVGIHPYIFKGLNMRRVFLAKAKPAGRSD